MMKYIKYIALGLLGLFLYYKFVKKVPTDKILEEAKNDFNVIKDKATRGRGGVPVPPEIQEAIDKEELAKQKQGYNRSKDVTAEGK